MCTLKPPAVVLEKILVRHQVLLGLKRLAPRIDHFSVVGMQSESGLVQVDVPHIEPHFAIQHPRNTQLPDVDLGALAKKPAKLVQDPDLGEDLHVGGGIDVGVQIKQIPSGRHRRLRLVHQSVRREPGSGESIQPILRLTSFLVLTKGHMPKAQQEDGRQSMFHVKKSISIPPWFPILPRHGVKNWDPGTHTADASRTG